MSKLTAVQIRQAKPKDKPYKLPDGQGLYFHVAESGKSTWRYRFRVDGKESTCCVLGEYPDMSLEQARKARAEAREQVKAGKIRHMSGRRKSRRRTGCRSGFRR
ncbi:Arm DNA-binding domain-containing protein [Candidatus Electronema sp. JC]|uniref:Arm DNA-binding domain-containing protein n=1 Tax=Candidatus Electronema sp. JC TaxID=3401570 RepID=UPI003B434068